MVVFHSSISKPAGARMAWILRHPEYVVCQCQADRLNARWVDISCNLHPNNPAMIEISLEEKRLSYQVKEICCNAFRRDVDQLLIRVRSER